MNKPVSPVHAQNQNKPTSRPKQALLQTETSLVTIRNKACFNLFAWRLASNCAKTRAQLQSNCSPFAPRLCPTQFAESLITAIISDLMLSPKIDLRGKKTPAVASACGMRYAMCLVVTRRGGCRRRNFRCKCLPNHWASSSMAYYPPHSDSKSHRLNRQNQTL